MNLGPQSPVCSHHTWMMILFLYIFIFTSFKSIKTRSPFTTAWKMLTPPKNSNKNSNHNLFLVSGFSPTLSHCSTEIFRMLLKTTFYFINNIILFKKLCRIQHKWDHFKYVFLVFKIFFWGFWWKFSNKKSRTFSINRYSSIRICRIKWNCVEENRRKRNKIEEFRRRKRKYWLTGKISKLKKTIKKKNLKESNLIERLN